MKKVQFLILMQFLCLSVFGLNVTIIESQSFNVGHAMDIKWSNVIAGMGHTPIIVSQSTLDNNSFFVSTDILIVSSGVINLPANRVNTILQFIQSGKSVYLQSEYLPSYSTNQAFKSFVTSLGGFFTWNNLLSGDLQPMNVLGTFSTTNNSVSSLSYFWYSVSGYGDCNTIGFLEYGGEYHGFQYIPQNKFFGSIITTTDQDWVRSNTSPQLMENIITHLISPPQNYSTANINFGNDTALCPGEILMLNATTSNASYLWQDNSTNPNFTVTQPGTYWVQATANNCSKSDTIHVNYNPLPTIALDNDTILCTGEILSLDATTSNGTCQWQDNSTNPVFTVTQPGTYWVQATINNCSKSDTIHVDYNPLPTVSLDNDTILCTEEILNLNATTSNASYLWQDNSTNPIFSVTRAGTYWVQATVNNCSKSDTIHVSYNTLPIFVLGNDTALCQEEILNLNATTSNAIFLWQDNSTNPIFNVTQSGTYWVQATVNNCSKSDTIHVNYNPLPTFILDNDTMLCAGEILNLDATTSNASYLWQDNSTKPIFNVTQSGTYWVQATVNKCNKTDTIHVNYNPLPNLILGNDTSLCQGEILTLNAKASNATYLWQDNSSDQTFTVTEEGTYWVKVMLNNCSVKDTIKIESKECELTLEIPNIFTPNNDGINDYFHPKETNGINNATLIIYNSWGQKIIETNNIFIGWDGKYNNTDCSDGTYFWIIKYSTITNESTVLKGFLTLIK